GNRVARAGFRLHLLFRRHLGAARRSYGSHRQAPRRLLPREGKKEVMSRTESSQASAGRRLATNSTALGLSLTTTSLAFRFSEMSPWSRQSLAMPMVQRRWPPRRSLALAPSGFMDPVR